MKYSLFLLGVNCHIVVRDVLQILLNADRHCITSKLHSSFGFSSCRVEMPKGNGGGDNSIWLKEEWFPGEVKAVLLTMLTIRNWSLV